MSFLSKLMQPFREEATHVLVCSPSNKTLIEVRDTVLMGVDYDACKSKVKFSIRKSVTIGNERKMLKDDQVAIYTQGIRTSVWVFRTYAERLTILNKVK